MVILSHRGHWQHPSQQNSLIAFHRALEMGFGIETDIRWGVHGLVLSHDPPVGDVPALNELLQLHRDIAPELTLALNIKADGLAPRLAEQLRQFKVQRYFVFDMSVPETIRCAATPLVYFTRQSEYEPTPCLYEQAAGVWLDCFLSEWMDDQVINLHQDRGKQVCIVSPELHRRDPLPFWNLLRSMKTVDTSSLMLCTDHSEQAQSFFNESH